MLSSNCFKAVVSSTPLVALDLLITTDDGLLVGKRNNEPAKSTFFVPGGRIFKDETVDIALERIFKSELDQFQLEFNPSAFSFFGIYEHFYPNSCFVDSDITTHYIVLAHQAFYPSSSFDTNNMKVSSDQHESFSLVSSPDELDHELVLHPHTIRYLNDLNF